MAAVCTVGLDAEGRIDRVRSVLVGAGPGPQVVSTGAEPVGERPLPELWADCAARWAAVVEGDEAEYRRDLAATALRRALADATRRAEEAA